MGWITVSFCNSRPYYGAENAREALASVCTEMMGISVQAPPFISGADDPIGISEEFRRINDRHSKLAQTGQNRTL